MIKSDSAKSGTWRYPRQRRNSKFLIPNSEFFFEFFPANLLVDLEDLVAAELHGHQEKIMDRSIEVFAFGIGAQRVDAEGAHRQQSTDDLPDAKTLHQTLLGKVSTVGREEASIAGADRALEMAKQNHEPPFEDITGHVLV